MAITGRKLSTDIVITGSSQSETTESILGRIDQLIIKSTVPDQTLDIILTNHTGLEIFREEGVLIRSGTGNSVSTSKRPNVLPMGPLTITLENPLPASGTITITIIEKERES